MATISAQLNGCSAWAVHRLMKSSGSCIRTRLSPVPCARILTSPPKWDRSPIRPLKCGSPGILPAAHVREPSPCWERCTRSRFCRLSRSCEAIEYQVPDFSEHCMINVIWPTPVPVSNFRSREGRVRLRIWARSSSFLSLRCTRPQAVEADG